MLLKSALAVELDPPVVRRLDLRVEEGRITGAGRHLARKRHEEVVDLGGKVVMPGLVCAHTHLYSSLARGMPGPARRPRSFPQILERVWWKLDRALDEESIYFSALVGAIEAVRCGTTTIVDHHASPGAIVDSLGLVAAALRTVGVRGVLCYEVTDRGGAKERDEGLEANDWFIAATRQHPLLRGLVGAHASFTLTDESLGALSDLASRYSTGIHIHLAEDHCDERDATRRGYRSVVDRLDEHGLLTRRSVLAHGVHLTSREIGLVRKAGAWLVHNPRSNMNNHVGHAPVGRFGPRTALGTDGFPADMFEEARFGQFKVQESPTSGRKRPMTALLQGGQRLVSELFGAPFGRLRPGAVADLVVLDYASPTPMTAGNLFAHVVGGMRSAMVESVIAGGRWVVKDRIVAGIDVADVHRRASKVAARLWERMRG
jgi:putative selenium metabolism protein SsnA